MSPVLFAAAVAGFGLVGPGDLLHDQDPAKACARFQQKTADLGGTGLRRLDRLPPAVLERAVLRSIEGCPVREVRHGQSRYLADAAPRVAPATPAPR